MIQVLERRIVVPRSLQDSYAYLQDFSTIEQWDPGVLRAEKVTPGPVTEGTQYRLTLDLPGPNRATMIYRQQRIQPGRCIELVGTGAGITALDTLTFRALGPQQTEITYRAELTLEALRTWSKPLISPLLQRLGSKAATGLQNALTPAEPPLSRSAHQRLRDRLILCKMADFGKRGYLAMPRKAHSHRMEGKTVLITGPTAGLGLAAAGELARLGASLILLGRDSARLKQAVTQIRNFAGTAPGRITVVPADLSSLSQTALAATRIWESTPRLDVIINNAGALFGQRQESSEGNELTLAVNLLAPQLLVDHLARCMTDTSRIINVVSAGLYLQRLHLDDMQFEKAPFSGTKAYARAKRALLTLTQYQRTPGLTFAVHPGWANTPGVAKSLPNFERRLRKQLRDPRMGADTMVWLASDPGLDHRHAGKLWFDRQPQPDQALPGTAADDEQAEQLAQWVANRLAPYVADNPLRSKAS